MAETLKQTVDRLVRDALVDAKDMKNPAKAVRHAVCEAIRAALSEPNEAMKMAGSHAICEIYRRDGGWCGMKAAEEQMLATWNATAAERLKELN